MKENMINHTIKIFDNIGAYFLIDNEELVILGGLKGYQTLTDIHVGEYIPYLIKSEYENTSHWEMGIGEVRKSNNRIIVKRVLIRSSSNNNKQIFVNNNGLNTFFVYISANQFNTQLNNTIFKNSDFIADTVGATYIIDASSGLVHAELPDPKSNRNLELRFKLVSSDKGRVTIRHNKQDLSYLSYDHNQYTSFISDGNQWIELNNYQNLNSAASEFSALSSATFNIQNQTNNAIPYYAETELASTNIYWGDNNKILLGDSVEDSAFAVIPSSGNYDTVFNNTNNNSNFIIKGSGEQGNLYFSSDGRLGLNMPSGSDGSIKKPITLLHVVNTFCRDAIRVDNRSDCFPSNLNLYHRPYTDSNLQNDKNIGNLIFSSVTSDKVYSIYGNIAATAKSITPGSSKGQIDISVNSNSPQNTLTTISTNPDQTFVGYNSSNFTVSTTSAALNSTTINLNGGVNISGTLALNSGAANINGVSFDGNGRILASTVYVNDPNILPNQLLAVNNDRQLYAATGIRFGLQPNKVVTTDDTGTLVGTVDVGSYLSTGPDLTWNKYNPRSADVCLQQLSFATDDQPAVEEFSVGDQIAIIDASGNYTYRYIESLTATDNAISSAILDQDIGSTVSSSVSVVSVSKGGYLVSQVASVNGPASDATYIRLSTQPGVDTVFNGNRKNINFSVYSTEDAPAFRILSDASTKLVLRGTYFKYATQIRLEDNSELVPGSVAINSDLTTVSSFESNTVNYNTNSVSSRLNGRPTFYGTFDQNGNAFEWVENSSALNNNKILSWTLGTQYICGGSWKTDTQEKLKSIVSENFSAKKPDIGFRVCKRYNFIDNSVSTIYQSLSFVEVLDINNPPDLALIYKEGGSDRYDSSVSYDPNNNINIPNLGRVNHAYQISTYEVTNSEYLQFLQSIDINAESVSEYYVTSNSYNDESKGITVSNGEYTLSDGKYLYAPVTYITYLNAIRFINWLHNGALSRSQIENLASEESVTTDVIISRIINSGSYTINSNNTIVKNNDQRYWLPSLNEWHKAAYYRPAPTEEESGETAILVKSDLPKEISSGNLASVTVAGGLYADELVIGSYDDIYNVLKVDKDISNNYNVKIGTDDLVTIPDNQDGAGTYGTYISNTGIVLATNGKIKIVCANETESNIFEVSPSGIFAPKLTIGSGETKTVIDGGGITKVDSTDDPNSPTIIEQYEGPASGILYKSVTISDDQTTVIDAKSTDLLSLDLDNQAIIFKNATNGQVLYANLDTGYLQGNAKVSILDNSDGINGASGVLKLVDDYAIDTPLIRIGPPLETYKGRILTHDGEGVAIWGPSDFLRADGLNYNRFVKRSVAFNIVNGDTILSTIFSFTTDLSVNEGGTGPVDAETIESEFGLTDTIAIYTPTGKIHYCKLAITIPQQSTTEDVTDTLASASLFINRDQLTVQFTPPIPDDWSLDDLKITTSTQTNYIAYAFSVQKGSYLDMQLEPGATDRFSTEGLDPEGTDPSVRSELGFKPSTANTISIRPHVYTSFNKVAEDIDFAIYGYRKTLYNRYEPEWFNQDSNGLPTGITPAFYVHSYVENSFEGSIISGINRAAIRVPKDDSGNLLVDEIYADSPIPDLNPKLCINTKEPFALASLDNVKTNSGDEVGIYRAVLRINDSDSVTYGMPSGTLVVTEMPLTKYADLTVSGYLYSNNIVADSIYLNFDNSVARPKYIANAPLTINNYGEIISLIPPAPPTPPGPPRFYSNRNSSIFESSDGVTVYWRAPVDDGRSPIYSYVIQYSSGIGVENSTDWITYLNPNNDDTPNDLYAILNKVENIDASIAGSGLKEDVTYKIRIFGINYEGSGVYSSVLGNTDATALRIIPTECAAPENLIVDRKFVDNEGNSTIIETYEDDGFTVLRYTNPILKFDQPSQVGTNPPESYVIDYAPLYTFNTIYEDSEDPTQGLEPVKELQWTSAVITYDGIDYVGEIDATITEGAIITQIAGENLTLNSIPSDMTYYFRVRPRHENGYGSPVFYKSVGTRGEPVITAPVIESEDWDFGVTTFTGVCS